MDTDNISDVISAFEKDLALPPGFLLDLRKEDDWSFIIKAHALLEAALSHTLAEAAGTRELEGVFSRVEMSDKDAGKLAFAEKLDVLREGERRFIRKLSELRNRLVHNITEIGFDLSTYVKRLDSNQRESFSDAFNYAYAYQGKGFEKLCRGTADAALRDPHGVIFLGVVLITLALYDKKVAAQRYQKRMASMKTLVGKLQDINRKRRARSAKAVELPA